MSAIRQIPIIARGLAIAGIEISIGATVNFNIACQDPDTLLPIDLTGSNVSMSLNALGAGGLPLYPALFTHQATITLPASNGNCVISWTTGDTVPSGIPIAPGRYGFDMWLTDISGNRIATVAYGTLKLLPVATLPGAPVTPSPSQSPLAQGPPGLGLSYTFQTAAYSANFLDQVVCDPTAGSFNVTLPLISTLTAATRGLVSIVHGSLSGNTIGVVVTGSDRILISGAAQSLFLINQGEALRLNPSIDAIRGNRWIAF